MNPRNIRLMWLFVAAIGFIYGISFAVAPGVITTPAIFWVGSVVCTGLFLAVVAITVVYLMRRTA